MSVLTLPAQPDRSAAPGLRPVPWQRMLWVTWRQHRGLLVAVTAVLAGVSVFLLVMGLKVHHDYAALVSCRPQGSAGCATLQHNFDSVDWTTGNTVGVLMQFAPPLLGAFAGAGVLARELETGTFRYAWTQGIGRVRWAVAKLTLLAVVLTVLAWGFSQLYGWFCDPFLGYQGMNVLAATVFDTRGVAFAAWVLVAFVIGAFLGMLLRRTVPAMAATLGAYLALNLLAWLVLREDYPVAINTTDRSLFLGPSTPDSPWILKTWTVGHTDWWRYIPVSRFWPMQFIEAGWLLVLSVIICAATVRLVRRRAA
jgi:ABC-type transport system involved in multi-copper enzyme maturation permease subunit